MTPRGDARRSSTARRRGPSTRGRAETTPEATFSDAAPSPHRGRFVAAVENLRALARACERVRVPTVEFTRNLERHVRCPAEAVPGATVREALEAYFARHPAVRGYVLDEQGAVRHHVVVFVDARQLADRARLDEPVAEGSAVYVMQALSGG